MTKASEKPAKEGPSVDVIAHSKRPTFRMDLMTAWLHSSCSEILSLPGVLEDRSQEEAADAKNKPARSISLIHPKLGDGSWQESLVDEVGTEESAWVVPSLRSGQHSGNRQSRGAQHGVIAVGDCIIVYRRRYINI